MAKEKAPLGRGGMLKADCKISALLQGQQCDQKLKKDLAESWGQ